MRYLVATLVLLIGVLGFIHTEEPHLWNSGLMAMRVPESGAESGVEQGDQASIEAAPAKPKRTAPEIISPESTHINPAHIHPVDQPGDIPASTNAAPVNK